MLKFFILTKEGILFLALFLGLVAGGLAQWTTTLVLPLLGLVMTLSTMLISNKDIKNIKAIIQPVIWGIVMNYFLLSGVILLLAFLIVSDPALWTGFVLLASVPPAIAVIPFADVLNGHRGYALFGTMGAYLAGLVIMPIMALLFLGDQFLQPVRLLIIIAQLIVLPLILSRVILAFGWDSFIKKIKGPVTNWSFFVVVFTIVGLNRDIFLSHPQDLWPVLIIAFVSTFGLGTIIDLISKTLKQDKAKTVSLMLLGILKNYGLAGGVALNLFSNKTALPATVSVIFMVVYMIWLNVKKRRAAKG